MSHGYYNPQAPPDNGAPAMLGGYRLIDLLGRGGMGEVWRAEQEGPGNFRRRAAVKRILPRFQSDPTLRARFVAEARINARLEHPNIVQVLSFGDQPEPYLALEYVEGTTVAKVLKQCAETGQRIPPAAVAYMLAEAAKGLDYAHRKRDENGQALGIVHRDVSPQNILLSLDGAVKISDFGIARAADNQFRTAAGVQVGKLSYMAPEQVLGQPVDHRADVFSLAVVLWETLLVRPLVPRNDPNAALQLLTTGQFEPPSRVDPRLSPVIDQIVMSALAVNPAQRTATAGDLAAMLQTFVHAISPGFDGAELVRVLAALMPSVTWHHPGGAPRPASLQFAPGGAAPAQPAYPEPAAPDPYAMAGAPLAGGALPPAAAPMNGRPGTLPPPTSGGLVGGAVAPLALGGVAPPPSGANPLGGLGGLPPSPSSGGGLAPLSLGPLPSRDLSQPDDRGGAGPALPSLDPPKPKPIDRNKLTYLITGGIAFVMVALAAVALILLTRGSRDPVAVTTGEPSVSVTMEEPTAQPMPGPVGSTPSQPAPGANAAVMADYRERAVRAVRAVSPQVQRCIRTIRSGARSLSTASDFDNSTGRVVNVTINAEGVASPELQSCVRGALYTASFQADARVTGTTRVLLNWGGGGGAGGGGSGGGAPAQQPRFPFGSSSR